ncbi:MAG: zinc ribbon domain-containing protein [Chloroflexota bacterium]|nr:zinc ribbon domain-containing protein [Chloroflexota bacterium]
MPSYEYSCLNCERSFEIVISYEEYDEHEVVCPYCDSEKVQRLISRVRFAKSDEQRLESMADPADLAGLEDDPKALGRMMRKMSREMGEDLGPEFDEVVDRLEKGQSPDEIERDLPDLGDDMGAGTGGMGGMGGMPGI